MGEIKGWFYMIKSEVSQDFSIKSYVRFTY